MKYSYRDKAAVAAPSPRRDVIRFGVGSLGNSDARRKTRKDASNNTARVGAAERAPSRKMNRFLECFKTQNEAGIIHGCACNILLCAIIYWCDFVKLVMPWILVRNINVHSTRM